MLTNEILYRSSKNHVVQVQNMTLVYPGLMATDTTLNMISASASDTAA